MLRHSLQPVVFLFWVEILLAFAFAILRAATSLGGRPFADRLGERIVAVVMGLGLGTVCAMLGVAFSIGAFEPGLDAAAFAGVRFQSWTLAASYAVAFAVRHLRSGRYRTSEPTAEVIGTFVHAFAWLALLMPLTMHLLPRFPGLDRAWWAGFAVLAVKFGVDRIAEWFGEPGPEDLPQTLREDGRP